MAEIMADTDRPLMPVRRSWLLQLQPLRVTATRSSWNATTLSTTIATDAIDTTG